MLQKELGIDAAQAAVALGFLQADFGNLDSVNRIVNSSINLNRVGLQSDTGRVDPSYSYRSPKDNRLDFTFRLVNKDNTPYSLNTYESRSGKPAPILTFKVNPASFDRPYKKIVSREMTRGAWVEFHGGDELDVITASGASGTMYFPFDPASGTGNLLVNVSEGRKATRANKFITDLIGMFKNNGNTYDARGFIYDTAYVLLQYDVGVYRGQFETLTVSESSEDPYQLEYSFSFLVEETLYKLTNRASKNHSGWSAKQGGTQR
jgi:hypothetical protein